MSYRRNNTATATATTTATTHATHPTPSAARQRSYIVNIDTGSFSNVEIIVGDYHHRSGVWTPSRHVDTVKVTSKSKSHVYAYGRPSSARPAIAR